MTLKERLISLLGAFFKMWLLYPLAVGSVFIMRLFEKNGGSTGGFLSGTMYVPRMPLLLLGLAIYAVGVIWLWRRVWKKDFLLLKDGGWGYYAVYGLLAAISLFGLFGVSLVSLIWDISLFDDVAYSMFIVFYQLLLPPLYALLDLLLFRGK